MDQSPIKMPPQPEHNSKERLDSWKEIAAYLNRGTRTVQRWEREENLPVHRLRHDKLGSVYAYKPELDAWFAGRRADLEREPPPGPALSPSIAVLPFSDMSQEKDQEYFCDGVTEEVINALGKLRGARVASRTSSFQFKGTALDSREIGKRLGVSTLLEGSVRKSGKMLRIALQLTDTAKGYQIWSERYDREMDDIFAIQEEIARNIVRELEVTLSPKERAALQKTPTKDVQAYDYYLRGRSFYYRYGHQDVEFARQLFQHAVELDPDYALAHAGLADCYFYTYFHSARTDLVREQADAASRRAVELDAESAQAWASRGLSLSLSGQDQEAEAAFETAVRLDPNLFEAHYFHARHCFASGRPEQAARLYEEAMKVRPEDYQPPLLVAQVYEDLGRPEDAAAVRGLGVRIAQEHLKLNPDDARAVYMAANGLAALGEREKALEWAERARAMRPRDSMVLYNIGCIYSLLGAVDEALGCLEGAVDNGLTLKAWLMHDSNLDPLREHPRFHDLLRRME